MTLGWFNHHHPPPARAIDYAPPENRGVAAMRAAEREIRHINRLDDIALALRTMPYGAFTEFADAVQCPHAKLWQWATRRR
jgi:hypothetical protein